MPSVLMEANLPTMYMKVILINLSSVSRQEDGVEVRHPSMQPSRIAIIEAKELLGALSLMLPHYQFQTGFCQIISKILIETGLLYLYYTVMGQGIKDLKKTLSNTTARNFGSEDIMSQQVNLLL